jgi:hypothetical protein
MTDFRRMTHPILLLAASACSQQGATPASNPVPIVEEPRHRPVFQNGMARVLDVRVPSGDTTGYHVHTAPSVGVVVEGARTWMQPWGGEPGKVDSAGATGELFDNWARALPYSHRVGNADTVAFHYVVGEWLETSGRSCEAPTGDATRHVVKDGRHFQVIEVRLPPHAASAPHTHACPGLFVVAATGKWTWHEADHQHELRNSSDAPSTVIEIDWR